MALTSALYTGLSGLNVNQETLSVVGNNIANVNTTAFKASVALFSPQFYTTDQSGTAPSGNFGGTNPSQQGLGAQVAAVAVDFSAGAIKSTGVNTEMAIDGGGFFITNSGSAGQQYTRDGTFTLNSNNQLVTNTGAFVQGYGADGNGTIVPGALQNITIPLGQTTIARATQNVTIQGNLNSGGDVATGASIFTSQAFSTIGGTPPTAATNLVDLVSTDVVPVPLVNVGDVLTVDGTRGSRQLPAQTLTVTPTTTVGDLQNFLNEGFGIDTTVVEPGNPTPGATLQTVGTTGQLTVIGNTGTENALSFGTTGVSDSNGTTPFLMNGGSDGGFTNAPIGESAHTTITAYDSLGTPVTVDLTSVLASKADSGNVWQFYATSPDATGGNGPIVGEGTLTFNNNGQLLSSTGTIISVPRTGTGAGTPVNMTLDFGGVTSLSSSKSTMVMSAQDGLAIGSLSSFSIGEDGTITGAYSNGQNKSLGQVALAMFNNPQGLINSGANMFSAGADSGVAIVTGPGDLGSGLIRSGSLEESNVDISKEFINMIIASTGFSASSKVISTSNQLLTTLLNTQQG